jgi:serine protease Do
MEDLQKYGRVRHAILGVTIQDVGPADARAAGLKEIQGVLVGGLTRQSAAAKAGIQPGDIITAINGHPVDQVSTLQRVLFGFQPGDTIALGMNRYGVQRTVQVALGEPPSELQTASSGDRPDAGTAKLGIAVVPVSPDIANQMRLPSGTSGLLVERVDPTGPAAMQLEPGDIIESILGAGSARAVHSVDDLQAALSHAASGVVSLLVYSPQAGGTRVVNIQTGP